jgi:shikimate kinase
MDSSRRIKNLALVGFMGTGKTTVGQILAHMLRFRFLDTDETVEGKAGRKISEIFAEQGEMGFRALESEVVAELELLEDRVISTGGGLILNPSNLESLKRHALVVCLWAPAEVVMERVGRQIHRPLLRCDDPLARIRELLHERAPAYQQADVLVNSAQRSPREVAQIIAHQFRSAHAADTSA